MSKLSDRDGQLLFLHYSGLWESNAVMECAAAQSASRTDGEAPEQILPKRISTEQIVPERSGTQAKGGASVMGRATSCASGDGRVIESVIGDLRAVDSLEKLKKYILNFTDCGLAYTATQAVFADGNPDAPIVIVGEAPGADEDRQGLPFVGRAGKLLDQVLSHVRLNRETDVYITNVVPWRPPGNRTPTSHELDLCIPMVKKHIELCAAQCVVLLGAIALRALTDCSEGIVRSRGSWFQSQFGSKTVQMLATFHPAFLLRQPMRRREFWQDFLDLKSRF